MHDSTVNRRHFLQGLLASSALTVAIPAVASGAGTSNAQNPWAKTGAPPALEGNEFELTIGETWVNVNGTPQRATTVNDCFPGPTLHLTEGEMVTIRVRNTLNEPTSIHWHGILLPFQMDGVPGISFDGIQPGATFEYRFTLQQSGTYWYHSHSALQELTGLFGALIVHPAQPDPAAVPPERDHVLILSDWTKRDPATVLRYLRAHSHSFSLSNPTVGDFWQDVSRHGLQAAWQKRQMWQQMRMSPTDLADLSSLALNYLINGCPAQANLSLPLMTGQKHRLRFINAAGHTFYDVRIPGLTLTVIEADGQTVQSVPCEEFRLGPGQTLAVEVVPEDAAYTLFAQSMDRSGYARATLSTGTHHPTPPVPPLDPVAWLTMQDMMGDMTHGSHDEAHMVNGTQTPTMPDDMAGMAMTVTNGHMEHSGHAAPFAVHHARTEFGPSTDMRVDMPRRNLDDPGVGLRDLVAQGLRPAGHRVLTLADLKTIGGPLDRRAPTRVIELHLTGNMERYRWSMDGVEFSQSTPVHFPAGERIRVILHNDTMMTHPMHLHGMWAELESPEGAFQARLHTIPVQPAQRIQFQVTADALGRWAWHCHLMYHMDMGMFREVIVA